MAFRDYHLLYRPGCVVSSRHVSNSIGDTATIEKVELIAIPRLSQVVTPCD